MDILKEQLETLKAKRDFSTSKTVEVFNDLRHATDEILVAKFLDAWAKKGVTSVELSECARILRENAINVETKHPNFIDIVGTGGSKAKIFNVSTAAAFVVAGANLPVAKHGNRAASSKTGSADALSELGVNIVAETKKAKHCLDKIGICFMFAPKFHNLTKELALARRALGKPTIFNLLGPMANPANAPFQLIGVYKKEFMKPMAEAISELGTKKTWIVHGEDGLDEITLNGKSYVAEIGQDKINHFEICPEDFGLERNSLSGFVNISPTMSAKMIRDILNGRKVHQAAIDIVLINAAAGIYLSELAEDSVAACELAKESLRSGAAMAKLDALIEETNR